MNEHRNRHYFSDRVDDLDKYVRECKEHGLTPDPAIVCFDDFYKNKRAVGIRQGFNQYAEMHRRAIAKESIYFKFYHKVMLDRNGVNLLIYTKEEVINWDPLAKTILWAELNARYPFEVPFDKNKGSWQMYVGTCIYGVLVAHGLHVADLCDIIDCSSGRAMRITAGRSEPSVAEIFLLAESFGMTTTELLRH